MRLCSVVAMVWISVTMATATAQTPPPDSEKSGFAFKRLLDLGSAASNSADRYEVMRATGYVDGIGDLLGAMGVVCYPEGVYLGQVREVVKKFLADHPERLHEPMPRLTLKALTDAFPCNNQQSN